MTYQGRREDPRLTTGRGRYTDDVSFPGQLRAVFLRSDHAHGRIASLNLDAVREADGVRLVLTQDDVLAAGWRRTAAAMPFPGYDGPMLAPESAVFAYERVRHVGEPLAVVIADTETQARDALELAEVEIEPLDAVVDPAAALAEGAPQLHDAIPGNRPFEYRFGDPDAVTEAFATAPHRVRIALTSERVVANPMEPKAAVATWTEDGVLELHAPSQGMQGQRDGLVFATGLPPEKVRVFAEDVGGAFGVRGDAYPEYIAIALASRTLGRPVKWLSTRSETMVSDYMGRGIVMEAELALDAEGRFLALSHDWIADLGSHPCSAGPLTSVMNAAMMATGAYRIPAIDGRVRLCVTNKTPMAAYRGAARPEMAYIVERLVDEAARRTGLDRIALRRLNAIPADAYPYPIPTAPMPSAYDSGDLPQMLDRGLGLADWDGFAARRAASEAQGRLRGIGCALFVEPSGGVLPSDEAAITFEADGAILLHELAVASGQGHETVFPELVASRLEIDPERISLSLQRNGGPAKKGAGAFGSRTLMSQGSVLVECARQVVAKAKDLAAQEMDVAPDDLDYADGEFRSRASNRTLGLMEIAAAHPGALDTTVELPSPRNFPSGLHVAEVEIDPETGVVTLERYAALDDCGVVVNGTLVAGQVWGGLMQGLGQVFGERCVYDAEGQFLTATFMDYYMPRADLLPAAAALDNLEIPSPTNELGAKGVGEAGTIGALPTVMNAVMDALAPRGVEALDMPVTPDRVWQALRTAAA
ncbi:xanthine dehydrogenase family protein molybdopterin-binding subunit [Albimonas sp. CAU 1670]|uniref:xanthine dehydrogenase family protein molybdopterin-binding subunit n=1 Tax=Albimonas sp. CAU 1670 TaxID=3032599 RepID=UPI0023D9BE4E|nr:xanthine dehydrogenase family protein molybdopterin-binding subunit [Albimonas sp. CAU 1670]MDF2233578.1 xanthine dehydrogenase family protein molybdopterin-binding subunit [Albimonas sp. CAU 1670]